MTLFNGTVRETALYSVLALREKLVLEKKKRKVIISMWSSVYFRLLQIDSTER